MRRPEMLTVQQLLNSLSEQTSTSFTVIYLPCIEVTYTCFNVLSLDAVLRVHDSKRSITGGPDF